MKEKAGYIKYCVFHPFEGFYEAKNRGKGSTTLAAILLILFCILQCVKVQYTGFVMNNNHISEMNSVTIFISYLTVILLAVVSNWTVTTLFEGKGKLKDIFLVVCYALVPVIIVEAITIFISNFAIMEELPILNALLWIGYVWCGFMILTGLCTIHEYGLAKNIVTLLATLVAAAIIMFLGVLFISLLEQMYGFITTFAKEWMRRIG